MRPLRRRFAMALAHWGLQRPGCTPAAYPRPGKFGDGLIGRAPKPGEMTEVVGTQA